MAAALELARVLVQMGRDRRVRSRARNRAPGARAEVRATRTDRVGVALSGVAGSLSLPAHVPLHSRVTGPAAKATPEHLVIADNCRASECDWTIGPVLP